MEALSRAVTRFGLFSVNTSLLFFILFFIHNKLVGGFFPVGLQLLLYSVQRLKSERLTGGLSVTHMEAFVSYKQTSMCKLRHVLD